MILKGSQGPADRFRYPCEQGTAGWNISKKSDKNRTKRIINGRN